MNYIIWTIAVVLLLIVLGFINISSKGKELLKKLKNWFKNLINK